MAFLLPVMKVFPFFKENYKRGHGYRSVTSSQDIQSETINGKLHVYMKDLTRVE